MDAVEAVEHLAFGERFLLLRFRRRRRLHGLVRIAWPSVYEGDLKTEELRERYRARFDRAYVYDIGWDEPFPWTR